MSVCGQNGHGEDDSASEEVGIQFRDKTSDIYKQKPVSKVVRVLTVLAYLLSVSLAAILLSVYYVCVWKSPELPLEPAEPEARRSNRSEYEHFDNRDWSLNASGGGDTAVNISTTLPLENITSTSPDFGETDFATDLTDGNTTDTLNTRQYTTSQATNVTEDIGLLNNTEHVT